MYRTGIDGIWASRFDYHPLADGTGAITLHTDATGNTTRYGLDNDGRPRTVVDPAGHTTTTTFNQRRDPLTITDPTGATTRILYTPDGDPAHYTDQAGHTTTLTYHAGLDGWPTTPTPNPLWSTGIGVAVGWETLRFDAGRGLNGGGWELVVSVEHGFRAWM